MNRAQKITQLVEEMTESPRFPGFKVEKKNENNFILHHESKRFKILVVKNVNNNKFFGTVYYRSNKFPWTEFSKVAHHAPRLRHEYFYKDSLRDFRKHAFDIPQIARDVNELYMEMKNKPLVAKAMFA